MSALIERMRSHRVKRGELEDEGDVAGDIAARIPHGRRLRLHGLGHEGACNASALTVPAARAFLEHWFAQLA